MVSRPVSTEENKHRMRSDWTFFHHLVLSAPPDQKKLKIVQLFIIRVVNHRFKLEQKTGSESPCVGSILFQSDPCLFSQVEISLNRVGKCLSTRTYLR